jgi:hypothetical protein
MHKGGTMPHRMTRPPHILLIGATVTLLLAWAGDVSRCRFILTTGQAIEFPAAGFQLGSATSGYATEFHSGLGFRRVEFASGATLWIVPYWPFALACGAVNVLDLRRIMIRKRREARVARGLCPGCGYDLRATPGLCPECGAAPPPPPPLPPLA